MVRVAAELGPKAVLLALAATCYHALALGGQRQPVGARTDWKPHDLQAVTALVESGALSLDGLITHTLNPGHARQAYETAFNDPQCLKMMIDWRA